MNWQRFAIGVCSLISLVTGIALQFANADSQVTGIMIRVGLLLGVIWLAMPQLKQLKFKGASYFMLVAIGLLVVLAARPKIFPIITGVLAVGMALSWALKWASKLSPPKK